MLSIFLWRDDDLHTGCNRGLNDFIGVVPAVAKQVLSLNAADQFTSLRAISHGTCRDNDSQRHTMRIHGQMYFCVSPPFVRPMS